MKPTAIQCRALCLLAGFPDGCTVAMAPGTMCSGTRRITVVFVTITDVGRQLLVTNERRIDGDHLGLFLLRAEVGPARPVVNNTSTMVRATRTVAGFMGSIGSVEQEQAIRTDCLFEITKRRGDLNSDERRSSFMHTAVKGFSMKVARTREVGRRVGRKNGAPPGSGRTKGRRAVKVASITPKTETSVGLIPDLSNTGPDFPWWAFI
jgi:hypothetical protein